MIRKNDFSQIRVWKCVLRACPKALGCKQLAPLLLALAVPNQLEINQAKSVRNIAYATDTSRNKWPFSKMETLRLLLVGCYLYRLAYKRIKIKLFMSYVEPYLINAFSFK